MELELLKSFGDWTVSTIERVGFPIALCVYFIVRLEDILKQHTEAIKCLTKTLLAK